MSSSILRRFLLAMALLGAGPALVMGLLLARATRSGMQASVLELHTKLAETTASRVADHLRSVDGQLGPAVAALGQPGLGWGAKQELMKALLKANPDLEEISLLRRGAEFLKAYNPRLAAPGRAWRGGEPSYQEYLRARRRWARVIPREDAAPRLEVYLPLSATVDVRACFALNPLWEWLGRERFGGTGFAVWVGPKGEPLAYPSRLPGGAPGSRASGWEAVSAALAARAVGSTEYEDGDGSMQIAAFAPVPETGGAILIQQPKVEAYAAAVRLRRLGGFILLVVCATAVLAAAQLARSMSGPLLELTRAAEKVAAGEFPAPVRAATGDELQTLADTFNRMVSRLRGYAEMQVDRVLLEQKRTEAILFSIGDGILVTDNGGAVQLANRRALEILELGAAQLSGRALSEVLPAPSRLGEAVRAVAADPSEKVVKEVDLSTDDRRCVVRVWGRPLVSPGKGTVLGAVTVIHDVTYEKELDKMKEEIVNSITHDLRSPVASILGFLDFMRKGVAGLLNQQQRDMVESMHKSASRLLALVNNILDVARLETHRPQVELKTASLAGLASHAIEMLASLAGRRGIQVELIAEEEFSIEVDPQQIERVFMNLLGNAIKFSPDDARVTIALEDLGGQVQATVTDRGPGIPPAYLEKVFEKFEQVPGTRRGGTGLGLTISRRFVEAHLGRIWAESEPDRGTRMRFLLPKGLACDGKGGLVARLPADA